jgi:hypothetical protein
MKLNKLKAPFKPVVSWVLFLIWSIYQLREIEAASASTIVLIDIKEMLPLIGFTAFIQYVFAWFPLVVFIGFVMKEDLKKSLIFYFPLVVVCGSEMSDMLTSTIYAALLDINSSLIKTILNSPQAALLVYMLPAFAYSLFRWRVKKIKSWVFMSITFMVFYAMNVIYHAGIIQGDMKYVVASVFKEQDKLLKITGNEAEAKPYCDFKGWGCYWFELDKKSNRWKSTSIGSVKIDKSSSEIIIKKLEAFKDNEQKIFERNFSLRKDKTAFLATAIKEKETVDTAVWFVVSDAGFFKEYFARADMNLSAMLAMGNLLWILIFMYLINRHAVIIKNR